MFFVKVKKHVLCYLQINVYNIYDGNSNT